MQHDYGVVSRGASFEYTNIHLPAVEIFGGDNVLHYDFYAIFRQEGREIMNARLIEAARMFSPDIVLFCLFENEIIESTITELNTFTKTAVYFFDDPWRQSYVRHWIQYFRYFSTPDYYMFRQYQSEGLRQAVYSPFGYNQDIYKKKNLPLKYEVSFVGGFSSYRQWVVSLLRKAGLDVRVFGRGWDGDRNWITTEQMVDIFNQSAVNLNLSNGVSYNVFHVLSSFRSPKALKTILMNRKIKEQVKGRHYEICGCGGFQLSYFVPGLNLAYEIDKEIAVFEDPQLLAAQIKFFLKHDTLRSEIAEAGYRRSLRDHSARQYLKNLFDTVAEGAL